MKLHTIFILTNSQYKIKTILSTKVLYWIPAFAGMTHWRSNQ